MPENAQAIDRIPFMTSDINEIRNKARREVWAFIALCVLFFILAFFVDPLDILYQASRPYEHLEVDELAATAIFAGILMLIYALRRNRELHLLADNLEKRNQELETALARVKELEGIIPICASCKNIRDDEGYWQKVEDYVSTHSKARFTHGLCPACAEKYYAEIENM